MRHYRLIPLLIILTLLAGVSLAFAPTTTADHHQQLVISQAADHRTAVAQPMAATQTVYLTRTGKCYHRDGCSCLRMSKIKTTKTAAVQRGFRACRLCKP